MKRFVFLLSFFLVLAMTGNGWSAIWHVTENGSDSNDGQSWNSAFATINEAVSSALEGDEIWVGAGTYILSETIYVNKAVGIYGGFSGNESDLQARDWVNNLTIVDGNNLVQGFQLIANATIDGFTIRNGYSVYGGGIRIDYAAANIVNCTFSQNRGYYYGGAIYNYRASPIISNCVFYGNTAKYVGGAIYNSYSYPMITNSTFHQNSVDYTGGAIGNSYDSSATITNSTFRENSAGSDGGAIDNYDSSPTITNCTFYKNSAGSKGRAIDNSFSSSPIITNSIFWGDPGQLGSEITNDPGSYPDVAYSDVQGGYPGDGNIDQDPSFVDPENGDFHLQPGSPCIDTGTDNVQDLPLEDFEGDPRIAGTAPDMGIDEVVEEAVGLDAYVLYAREKVKLRRIADSQGNVGSNGSISVARGNSGTITGNLSAVGKIGVMGSLTVDGNVLTNDHVSVYRRGWLDVTGEMIEGQEAGLSSIELAEPESLGFNARGKNVRVQRRQSLDLEPGAYRNVRVSRGATLRLVPGDYKMERLNLDRRATLLIEGPVTINVVKGLHIGRSAKIEFGATPKSDVTINVLKSRIIWVGPRAELRGTLYAPNSRVWLGYRSQVEGAVHARRIYANSGVHFQPHTP